MISLSLSQFLPSKETGIIIEITLNPWITLARIDILIVDSLLIHYHGIYLSIHVCLLQFLPKCFMVFCVLVLHVFC